MKIQCTVVIASTETEVFGQLSVMNVHSVLQGSCAVDRGGDRESPAKSRGEL